MLHFDNPERGFSLIEVMVALAIMVVIGVAVSRFSVTTESTVNYAATKSESRNIKLAALTRIKTLFARRNVSLDSRNPLVIKSYSLGTLANPVLAIQTRADLKSKLNAPRRVFNQCVPVPSGVTFDLNSLQKNNCNFKCPPGQASRVVIEETSGPAKTINMLLTPESIRRVGGIVDARFCAYQTPRAGGRTSPPVVIQISIVTYANDTNTADKASTSVEFLTSEIRDPNVEITF